MNPPLELSDLEYDALREMMNIGFGRAAATLSDIMDVNVILSVPVISMVGTLEIAEFVQDQAGEDIAYSMVEQFFMGKFSGVSILLLPEAEGKNLIGLFGAAPMEELRGEEAQTLARETIMEIGNILIGACVGMISELLDNHVTFRPPHYISGAFERLEIDRHLNSADSVTLVFKTVFRFSQDNIQGNLFLITSSESIRWMKGAIKLFLGELR